MRLLIVQNTSGYIERVYTDGDKADVEAYSVIRFDDDTHKGMGTEPVNSAWQMADDLKAQLADLGWTVGEMPESVKESNARFLAWLHEGLTEGMDL